MAWGSVVPTQRNRLLVALTALVTAVAGVDAARREMWGLVMVVGLAVVLQLLLLITLRAPRLAVPLRGDLFRWLDERSAATGEPIEHIADRSVAAYRAGLTGEPSHGPGRVEALPPERDRTAGPPRERGAR